MQDNKIGFLTLVSIVISAQLGASIFIMPSEMAQFRVMGLLGWIIAGFGAVLITMVFACLCSKSAITGGPHIYARMFFGNNVGFFITWLYWCAAWACNPIMVSASIDYLATITGPLSSTNKVLYEIALVLLLTLLNVRGIKVSGYFEIALTILKIIILLVIPFIVANKIDFHNFSEIVPHDMTVTSALLGSTITAFWGFVGLEGGASPSENVKNPQKTIPMAIIYGTSFVAIISLINTFAIFGIISPEKLENINAPFSFIMSAIFGTGYDKTIGIMTFLMCIGSLNAWVLLSGQIAKTAAKDNMLPKCFLKTNKYGAPTVGIWISSIGTIAIILLQQTNLIGNKIGKFMDMSVIVYIMLYLTTVIACMKFLYKNNNLIYNIITILAFAFCIMILVSSPGRNLLFVIFVIAIGIPIFVYLKKHQRN